IPRPEMTIMEALTPLPNTMGSDVAAIELAGVSKRFRTPSGDIYTAITGFTLTVGRGEFVSIVGPTGCGKSTTLSLISGLAPASGGEVRVVGRPVTGIANQLGFVFQGDVLFSATSVFGN